MFDVVDCVVRSRILVQTFEICPKDSYGEVFNLFVRRTPSKVLVSCFF